MATRPIRSMTVVPRTSILCPEYGRSMSGFIEIVAFNLEAGQNCSVADAMNFGWLRAPQYAGLRLEDYPAVQAWVKRIAARPAVMRGCRRSPECCAPRSRGLAQWPGKQRWATGAQAVSPSQGRHAAPATRSASAPAAG
jgi:hypothetical protein